MNGAIGAGNEVQRQDVFLHTWAVEEKSQKGIF